MIEVRPFRPYHLDVLRAQGVQAAQLRAISHAATSYAGMDVLPGPSVTAFDGEWVLICGGIIPMAPKRGVCWALMSDRAARHMTWLHYATKRFIDMTPWQRLEATVEDGFAAGCRWLDLLGFRFEGSMPRYGDDGETHLRYGRYA
jgi:hypothetical protein